MHFFSWVSTIKPRVGASFAIPALAAAVGCSGQIAIDGTSGTASGSGSGSGGQTTTAQTSGGPVSNGGATTTIACSPLGGMTDLLQSSLPGETGYFGVVSDGQHVYFASVTALYRIPVTGGAAETIYTGSLNGFYAATAGEVAWVPAASGTENPDGLTVDRGGVVQQVALPNGAVPSWGNILMDARGDVFFELDVPGSARSKTWKWDATTGIASEAAGIGMPAANAGTNLYWADRGQVVWSNNVSGPAGGLYVTDIASGTALQVVGEGVSGFGGLVGIDASNIYGTGSICPMGPCPFSVNGVPRTGGAPFVAFQSTDTYWTNGLTADDSGLYWIDWVTHSIYHAPLTGSGQVSALVQLGGSSIPSQLALDACNVYWMQTDATGAPHIMAIGK